MTNYLIEPGLGNVGHINVASGHTNWEKGIQLLKKFD
jgi:predicted alpha/beta hydrolase family esterase